MSPYSGGTGTPPTKTGHRFAWARLNADTLLIGLLAFVSGLLSVTNPFGDATIDEIGFPTPSFYLQCMMYFISGLGIIYSLIRQSVPVEVISRCVLMAAATFETYRYVRLFGLIDRTTFEQYVLLTLVLGTCALRLSILLSKRGLVVRLPERGNGGSES